MNAEYIVNKVEKLVCEHNTSYPFALCEKMDIHIYYRDLGRKLKAFYFYQSRIKNIVINTENEDELLPVLCAHELGHAVLHSDFAAKKSFCEVELFDFRSAAEREANLFAAELLIADEAVLPLLKDGCSVFEAAKILSVPSELIDFKLLILRHKGFKIPPLFFAKSDFLKEI